MINGFYCGGTGKGWMVYCKEGFVYSIVINTSYSRYFSHTDFFPQEDIVLMCHHAMIFSETGNENLSFLRKDIDREHQEVLIGFH